MKFLNTSPNRLGPQALLRVNLGICACICLEAPRTSLSIAAVPPFMLSHLTTPDVSVCCPKQADTLLFRVVASVGLQA